MVSATPHCCMYAAVCRLWVWEGVNAHSMQGKGVLSQGTALTHTDTYQHLLQLVN